MSGTKPVTLEDRLNAALDAENAPVRWEGPRLFSLLCMTIKRIFGSVR